MPGGCFERAHSALKCTRRTAARSRPVCRALFRRLRPRLPPDSLRVCVCVSSVLTRARWTAGRCRGPAAGHVVLRRAHVRDVHDGRRHALEDQQGAPAVAMFQHPKTTLWLRPALWPTPSAEAAFHEGLDDVSTLCSQNRNPKHSAPTRTPLQCLAMWHRLCACVARF